MGMLELRAVGQGWVLGSPQGLEQHLAHIRHSVMLKE